MIIEERYSSSVAIYFDSGLQITNYIVVDSPEEFEEAKKKKLAEIKECYGESRFRKIELILVKNLVKTTREVVIEVDEPHFYKELTNPQIERKYFKLSEANKGDKK